MHKALRLGQDQERRRPSRPGPLDTRGFVPPRTVNKVTTQSLYWKIFAPEIGKNLIAIIF